MMVGDIIKTEGNIMRWKVLRVDSIGFNIGIYLTDRGYYKDNPIESEHYLWTDRYAHLIIENKRFKVGDIVFSESIGYTSHNRWIILQVTSEQFSIGRYITSDGRRSDDPEVVQTYKWKEEERHKHIMKDYKYNYTTIVSSRSIFEF